eukprot:Gb_22400 [translate_table: standard]
MVGESPRVRRSIAFQYLSAKDCMILHYWSCFRLDNCLGLLHGSYSPLFSSCKLHCNGLACSNTGLLRPVLLAMEVEVEELQNQEVMLKKKIDSKRLETQLLEEKKSLLKAAVDMALDSNHPKDFYLQELGKRVEARNQQIADLELQWDTVRIPLEEKKSNIENSLYTRKSNIRVKMKELKAVQQEIKGTTTKILKRIHVIARLLKCILLCRGLYRL